MKGVRFSFHTCESEVVNVHGEGRGRDIHALLQYFTTNRINLLSIIGLTLQATLDTYPALNLIPTLNHPSAPQQQVLNQAKSASGGNSTP
jgi:hypothetical protein